MASSTVREERKPLRTWSVPRSIRHSSRPDTGGGHSVREAYKRIAVGMALTDAACIVVALGLAFLLRTSISPISREWLGVLTVAPLAWVAIFSGYGLYSPRHLAKFDEIKRLIGASTAGLVVIVLVSFWSHASFSRIWIGLSWLLAAILEVSARTLWRRHIEQLRKEGNLSMRTIVLGSNGEARRLWSTLDRPDSGFKPLSLYPLGDLYVEGDDDVEVRRYGGDLAHAIRDQNVECLFVASSDVTPEAMAEISKIARLASVDVRMSASLPEMISSRITVQPVAGMMAMALRPAQLSGVQVATKRVFDIVVSAILLLLLLPVCLLLALAVKFQSRGPVLFRQPRVTQGGRIFEMLKFRTMREHRAEETLNTSTPFFKLAQDPRITLIGRPLRSFSLDELPQLINVLKGDMSLVGPRPLPVDQVEANLDLLESRHEVPAGVTGWWQISGRSRVAPEEAIKMDLFYIENWSLGLDLYILLRTLGAVVARRGAI